MEENKVTFYQSSTKPMTVYYQVPQHRPTSLSQHSVINVHFSSLNISSSAIRGTNLIQHELLSPLTRPSVSLQITLCNSIGCVPLADAVEHLPKMLAGIGTRNVVERRFRIAKRYLRSESLVFHVK